jgi:hypothetical protein
MTTIFMVCPPSSSLSLPCAAFRPGDMQRGVAATRDGELVSLVRFFAGFPRRRVALRKSASPLQVIFARG